MKLRLPYTTQLLLAYFIVYIVWGANYLAILFAIDTIPPLFTAGLRFLLAGLLLYPLAIQQFKTRPTKQQLKQGIQQGFWLNVCGSGAVFWAEQYIASGLAALIVAIVPLWMVVLDRRHWRENFSSWPLLTGLFLGIAGVALICSIQNSLVLEKGFYFGLAILLLGTLSWAYGSLYSKKNSACYSCADGAEHSDGKRRPYFIICRTYAWRNAGIQPCCHQFKKWAGHGLYDFR